MNVYFLSGAHSTGKTTIINDLEASNDFKSSCIKVESEIARAIVKEWGVTQKDLLNEQIFKNLQLEILKRQYLVYEQNSRLAASYISDRGIDPLVYAKCKLSRHDFDEVLSDKYALLLLKILKNSTTFVVYPHRECIVDDGVRYVPVYEDLLEYHETLVGLLKELDIPFVEIKTLNRVQRVNIVLNHIFE